MLPTQMLVVSWVVLVPAISQRRTDEVMAGAPLSFQHSVFHDKRQQDKATQLFHGGVAFTIPFDLVSFRPRARSVDSGPSFLAADINNTGTSLLIVPVVTPNSFPIAEPKCLHSCVRFEKCGSLL